MLFFLERIAVPALQMDIEAPQPVQVLEHTLGGLAQGFAFVALVAQGQGAVATAVDLPDLDIGLVVAQVVLGGEQFPYPAVAGVVMDGGDLQVVVFLVVDDGEQLEFTDHPG